MKKQKWFLRILTFSITLGATLPVLADFEFYRGVRQMGMGGASIAVANDETALLVNPTGLGRLRDKIFTLFDPEMTASVRGDRPLLGTAVIGAIDPQTLYDNLDTQVDRPFYFKSQLFPSIVMPNFGFGMLARHEILAIRQNDGTYDYRYQNDYSINMGYNLSFWGGRIKWGLVGRLINRVESNQVLDPATDAMDLKSFASEGQGVAVDTSLTLTAPWRYLPTLTAVVRDVGNTSFNFNSGIFGYQANGVPQSVSQSIDVAVALFPIVNNDSRATLTAEMIGVTTLSQAESTEQRLRVGAEINYWDAYFFRAGYYNKTWTAGFEYANSLIQWQFATYAEPVPVGSIYYRDRRATLKFSVRF